MTDTTSQTEIESFITRWQASQAAERANYQLFLSELCDVLGVARPEPTQADDARNAYVFERAVTFHNPDDTQSVGRIDLYKRGCFVLEAKQGSQRASAVAPLLTGAATLAPARGRRGTAVRGTRGWDVAMRAARGQAEQYVRALPAAEGNPPFVVVADVGYSFELYADFTRAGKTYVPFPDARTHRLRLEDLRRAEVREQLRSVWTEPLSLDPARRSARVTRDVARQLAELARSLEASGYRAEQVANFLMRAIFTMFAEDVRLLPAGAFTALLEDVKAKDVAIFPQMVASLWATMQTGGFSPALREQVLRFNGGLFEGQEALPLDAAQLDLLVAAAHADWQDVEPAIFGTLLERALNPIERHKLGAHYTPRAYVERLVLPTVVEPLREEWEATLAAAVTQAQAGDEAAAETVKEFHRRLCRVRVLDPACGSGNFLYVTLEHLKRLEGEVLDALHGFGERQGVLEDTGLTVDPHQLLGLEVNPRAAAIADLVLWIGYLQWHFRTRGEVLPPEPVLKKFHNIECRDAVLAYDAVEPVADDAGQARTRWDGRSYKPHPVTGEQVPDETKTVPLLRYTNPRKADWPAADFIIGNPPFVGNKRMRLVLGDGYVEALREAHDDVPDTSDFVMYWWNHAANLLRADKLKRFGFVTTNSITQTFNRKVLQQHLSAQNSLSLVFAIPDHPWVDAAEGAQVRIAMTVADMGEYKGVLAKVVNEDEVEGDKVELEISRGKVNSDLSIGVNVSDAERLEANRGLACPGVQLSGQGFVVTADDLSKFSEEAKENLFKRYITGRDLTQIPRVQFVIDTFGLTESDLRTQYPDVYQWLLTHVKPEREHNPREKYAREWWLHSEPRIRFRKALIGLSRFIGTSRTSRYRVFHLLPSQVLPETKVLVVALGEGFHFGVLSSRVHVVFANKTGGWLGVGNDSTYNHSDCFDPFPFPDCDEAQRARIRALGEQLDAHRKRQQAQQPALTITDMYNVLAKLRANEPLSARERATHEQGLVSVLKQIHDELDAEVCAAYGWPAGLTDEDLLARLVALNAARAAAERAGQVLWLRPAFQHPTGTTQTVFAADPTAATPAVAPRARQPWPKSVPEQARTVRHALAASGRVVTAPELARTFLRARATTVGELLQTLAALGQAREVAPGKYAA